MNKNWLRLKKLRMKEIKLSSKEITMQPIFITPKELISLKMRKAKTYKKS